MGAAADAAACLARGRLIDVNMHAAFRPAISCRAPGWVHGDTPEQQQQPQPPEQPGQQQSEQQQQEQQEQPEPQQAEQGQQQGQQGQQAAGALAPGGERDRVYRLASMGQDCQLALWDIVVTEESVAAAQQASSVK